jgi:hypothetical protein
MNDMSNCEYTHLVFPEEQSEIRYKVKWPNALDQEIGWWGISLNSSPTLVDKEESFCLGLIYIHACLNFIYMYTSQTFQFIDYFGRKNHISSLMN